MAMDLGRFKYLFRASLKDPAFREEVLRLLFFPEAAPPKVVTPPALPVARVVFVGEGEGGSSDRHQQRLLESDREAAARGARSRSQGKRATAERPNEMDVADMGRLKDRG